MTAPAGSPPAPDVVPFHLRGNYAPVRDEVTAYALPVRGAVPRALAGRYVRNGPNPKTGQSPHWFLGDGMLHGVELRDGGRHGTATAGCAPAASSRTRRRFRPTAGAT